MATTAQIVPGEFLPNLQFDLETFATNGLLLAVAFLLALPVGWDRERAGRSAGLRTFPLVAVSSCAYVVRSIYAFGADTQAQARVVQGLITGIGFVGGGAIVKSSDRVQGTATAASIWTTGAIGATVAFGRLDIALLLSLTTFATLRWLHGLAGRAEPDERDDDV
ncbi:putative Mg(2+) transport ATPase [Planctomycetes bacterium Pla163]|uniref:Putative Mg(2+) transport ATPase n=1 Tax=Rohdeia mirabilis TaxID=2528008 RepID=A0A518D534_9BACT|nr:putative Mg(2+) transport ATPase [Planctomycetes bacterium Pla163]